MRSLTHSFRRLWEVKSYTGTLMLFPFFSFLNTFTSSSKSKASGWSKLNSLLAASSCSSLVRTWRSRGAAGGKSRSLLNVPSSGQESLMKQPLGCTSIKGNIRRVTDTACSPSCHLTLSEVAYTCLPEKWHLAGTTGGYGGRAPAHLVEGFHGQQHHPGNVQRLDDPVGHGGFPRSASATQSCETRRMATSASRHPPNPQTSTRRGSESRETPSDVNGRKLAAMVGDEAGDSHPQKVPPCLRTKQDSTCRERYKM